jgi:AraC family transcriptional regulator
MDWLDRMNGAIDYIEANLADEISYDKAAQTACCSTYHFQRMFSFITGVPLSEYIRRRRLTLAAFELQTGGVKVIDTALKYGYESPEAFSRAFKSLHGVQPALARDMGVALKAFPKMTFSISIKGDVGMNYRIEQRDAFEVFGVYAEVSSKMEQAFIDVPKFVKEKLADGTWNHLNDFLGRPRDTWFHAASFDPKDDTFRFMMCCHAPPTLEIPDKYTRLKVPAQTWAIFPEPECNVQDLWRRIYSEWFPASGYEQVEGAAFEMWYGYGRDGFGYGTAEVWIPVKKK